MESKRIGAFIIDFIIITLIYEIPFCILVMIPIIQGKTQSVDTILLRSFISTFICYILFVFKDVFKDGSIGKKVMKLIIIDSETKEPASLGKRILRNVTWLLSWVEMIVYLVSRKRIGDMLAKTDVAQK